MMLRATLLFVPLLASCADAPQKLPGCWTNADIKIGRPIAGTAIIEVNTVTPPILVPLSCEGGGGPARLPTGFSLARASRNGRGPSSMGAIFYKAQIEGLPTSKHSAGGYEFTLTSVTNVEGIWPSWLSPQHRDP